MKIFPQTSPMKYIKHVGVMESWWFHGEGDGVRDREREWFHGVMKIISLLGNGLEENHLMI